MISYIYIYNAGEAREQAWKNAYWGRFLHERKWDVNARDCGQVYPTDGGRMEGFEYGLDCEQ